MKRIAKQLSLEGCEALMQCGVLHKCDNGIDVIHAFESTPSESLCYEETVIWGFILNNVRCSVDERLAMLAHYIPVLDNWAVCDTYCANAKWLARANKERIWEFLQPWFASQREFEVRFALVASMCHLLDQEWLWRIFQRIDTLDFDFIKSEYTTLKGKPKRPQQGIVPGTAPYYTRMGVAWLLATTLAKYPDETREFVRSSHLPADVVKLYVRKARESFRTRNIAAL
jgi:3-methyladenine DNA glycosylase AlkD